MNEKGLKEQLKLSKKQNKETRYNYIAKSFNSIDYAMELEKYIFKLQQEKQELINKLNKAKEFVNKNMVIHSNAFGVVWCDIDEKGKEELLNILDLEKSDK